MRWCLIASLLMLTMAKDGWGEAPRPSSTEALSAIPYYEVSRPKGVVVLEMIPSQGKLPASSVAVEAATGKRLWRIAAYSPAALLYDNGERLALLNAAPLGGAKDGRAWALRFYHRGKKAKEYTLEDLAAAAKGTVPDLVPKKPFALSWLARVNAPIDPKGGPTLALVDGTALTFDPDGKLVAAVKGKKPKAEQIDRETALAEGYRRAREGRRTATGLNAFALQLHDRVATSAPAENAILSPYGLAAALNALVGVVGKEPETKILKVLTTGGEGHTAKMAEQYQRLQEVVAGPNRAPADRLGLELAEAPKGVKGLVVKRVLAGSPLVDSVKPGDKLLKVRDQAVSTPQEVKELIDGWTGSLVLVIATGAEVHHLLVPAVPAAPALRMRTTLWSRSTPAMHKALAARLKGQPQLDLEAIDPADSKKAAALINKQLAAFTHQAGTQLVQPRDLTDNFLLVTNALYFSAAWALPFDQELTDPEGQFQLAKNKTVKVPVMTTSAHLAYREDAAGKFSAVELPYRGRKYGLVVVVPQATVELRDVERALAKEGVAELFGHLDQSSRYVELHLPRLHLRRCSSLQGPLSALGLPKVLALSPELLAATGLEHAAIKDVRQQARIVVDEKGTEAYAISSIPIGIIGAPPKPVVVSATRPFLFLVRDRSSNAILFIGRVTNPIRP